MAKEEDIMASAQIIYDEYSKDLWAKAYKEAEKLWERRFDMNLKQAVTFSILMETHRGIIGKSPEYILERLRLIGEMKTEDELKGLLDSANKLKYESWKKLWEGR